MRDSISTPGVAEAVLSQACKDVGDSLREDPLYPKASVMEVVFHLRRLLADCTVAAATGNQGDRRGLVLALTDVATDAGAIARTAADVVKELTANDPALAEYCREATAGRLRS